MKTMVKSLIVFALSLMMAGQTMAQTVLDGVYIKENTPKRKVIPYAPLREADVVWSKRVWRIIDLREKINHSLYYPEKPANERKSMMDVVKSAIQEGRLTAFASNSDDFTQPLTKSEVEDLLTRTDTLMKEDINTGEMIPTPTKTDLESKDVLQYMLKEDWFFDKQRSVLDVRIIGICPMKSKMSESGEFQGFQQLFWIYYPEARYVFANAEVYNRKNDEERRTIEDVLWKRQFTSFIFKETNVYDRAIPEYKFGFNLDLLLESDRIKDDMFNWEHDLWHL